LFGSGGKSKNTPLNPIGGEPTRFGGLGLKDKAYHESKQSLDQTSSSSLESKLLELDPSVEPKERLAL
jgi:hypothetical protein